MRNRNDPNFVGSNLIEKTVGKSAQDIPAPCPAEDGADKRIRQYGTYGSVKLGDEREAKLGIRTRGVEGRGILQLAKRERKNYQLHFRAARTRARASAIGMT